MKMIRGFLAAMMLLPSLSAFAGFLQFPLHGCSDPSCTVNYATYGAYSANAMNSVLDHSMALNTNNYYPYGTTKTSTSGGNSVIKAFNGETVSGALLSSDYRCVGGTINLHPDWNPSVRMTNDIGCGSGYSSYDEHPGYDYKAVTGTPVYAATTGTVISTICYLGNTGAGTCADWGALAIRPSVASGGNNYFYQYLHMDTTIPGHCRPDHHGWHADRNGGWSLRVRMHSWCSSAFRSSVYPNIDRSRKLSNR